MKVGMDSNQFFYKLCLIQLLFLQIGFSFFNIQLALRHLAISSDLQLLVVHCFLFSKEVKLTISLPHGDPQHSYVYDVKTQSLSCLQYTSSFANGNFKMVFPFRSIYK